MSSGAIPTGIFAASSITGNLSATSSGLGAPNTPGPPKDSKVNLHIIFFLYFCCSNLPILSQEIQYPVITVLDDN